MPLDEELLRALDLSGNLEPTPANIDRVARQTNAQAAQWAFTQWELRKRAARKFQRANAMLFDREALEQSTHEKLAAYHASRFPAGVTVVDMTCGIGADLIAIASRGPVIGYEMNEDRLECARWNLEAYGLQADLRIGDSLEGLPSDYVFCDPSQRIAGKRSRNPLDYSPNPTVVAHKMIESRLGGIKLSPMLDDEFLESLGGSLEFVSLKGECREALVWLGQTPPVPKRAVLIDTMDFLEASDHSFDQAEEPLRYFYEVDPAAIRAHCIGTLCRAHDLQVLGDSNGYLTGSKAIISPWLIPYVVVSAGAYDVKEIVHFLKTGGYVTPDLKQRGCGLDLTTLRKRFVLAGRRNAWVAFWSTGKQIRYAILEKLRENT